MTDKVCLITGGFDPLHSGHIEYIKSAKEICPNLIIGLNSDKWLKRKKNFIFMPWKERAKILESLIYVTEVIAFEDNDDTACNAIDICLKKHKKVIFANGGDRKKENIPELDMFANNTNVEFKYGVGGNNKLNSSSSLTSDFYNTFSKIITLEKGNSEITDISSPWGFHNLIVDNELYKVKILSVNPFSQLSLQKHQYREEHWVVVKGSGEVDINGKQIKLKVGDYVNIPKKAEHCLKNTSSENMVVIETQLGKILKESDIERISDIYGRKSE